VYQDFTGEIFGQLTVQGFGGFIRKGEGEKRHWQVRCSCGNTKIVMEKHLKSGATQSCGCLKRSSIQSAIMAKTSHGARSKDSSIKSTYGTWRSMKQRCYNSKDIGYYRYGNRGIVVCNRWLISFENFLADMGPRPRDMTLDRYPDPSGNYEPSNCRWATAKQQANNRRARDG
jgi:hypothetical protein